MRIHAFHRLYQDRLQRSTKPFLARGSKIARCSFCHVPCEHCLCEYQPDIETAVAVMLLVSENEVFKPSNTGRLIADTVKETYVYQWHRTEPDPQMLALISDPAFFPVLVFPAQTEQDRARQLSALPKFCDGNKKPLLIFIDGSWREAKRIFRRSTYLASLPILSIEPEQLSSYLMRKASNEQYLATAEVASLVLSLCGEEKGAEALRIWFEAFKESYLLGKSRLKPVFDRPALKRWQAYQQTV
ncbi:DTW domain-containing protein [Vibrio cincinnatiensis]|uniref:tRNA-uridine aminocarboxypropyltransferase n=1 Tax=Vibrio cincinnatiensis TaxID=675 RepID=UPI001EDF5B08|nr:tRNA-uridine aminocarboxypropyltransferase [Vibrio cincinnatiensis]MCG3764662.1 DTW domain-containing protein [Vibrio cincinnatiensis]